MLRPWDNWTCPQCGRGMTLEAAAEGFCAERARPRECPLPLDLATLPDKRGDDAAD